MDICIVKNSSFLGLSFSSIWVYLGTILAWYFLDEKLNNLNILGLFFISIGLLILSIGIYNNGK